MDAASSQSGIRPVMRLAGTALVIGFLYFGREVFIPLALATLFALVLAPAASFMERRLRLGRALSVLAVVAALFSLVAGSTWLVGAQAAQLVDDLPKYRATLVEKARGISSSFNNTFGKASEAVERIAQEASRMSHDAATSGANGETTGNGTGDGDPARTGSSSESSSADEPSEASSPDSRKPVKVEVVSSQYDVVSTIGAFLGPVMHPFATMGAATVLLLFFLYNREDLRDRMIRLCGRATMPVTIDALEDCARRVRRFVLAQACANGLIGLCIGIGLYLMGLPNAALWGLIAAVARFVPYIGTFVAAALPFALAVAQFDGWELPIMVIVWCIFVDILSANTLEPWLYGARTGLAPTAILIAFMFWTWLWGGFGLFMATPITVCLVVMGKHVPAFVGLYILLTDEPVLEPATRFYQRLLARNASSAVKVAEEFAKEHDRVTMLDQMVLPGLAQVESDHLTGVVDRTRVSFALNTVEGLLSASADVNEHPIEMESSTRPIVLIPGDGEFDSLIRPALLDVAAARGLALDVRLVHGLTSEVAARVKALSPSLIILGAIEPRSSSRFRYIHKRLRAQNRSGRIVVLAYAGSRSGARMTRRLASDLTQRQIYSLAEIVDELQSDRPGIRSPASDEASESPGLGGTPAHA